MAQNGQPQENKPQEFSGCFCVVMGFIVGNILFGLFGPAGSEALFRPAANFHKVEIGASRGEIVDLLGRPKAESSTNPVPPNTYEHQAASRSNARHYLVWDPIMGPRHVVGLDAQDATVFKCVIIE